MAADRAHAAPTASDSPACPPLTICIDLPRDEAFDESRFKPLPARPGVLAIEEESGGTLALMTTANLRRAAMARLGPIPDEQSPSPRVNLRGIARRMGATTVGSAFEADWAYLQLARQRLPHTYRVVADRWQAWFICCDASERFPQWMKTNRPIGAGAGGACVGPFADKHAAHRFIEMVEDAFDLCRYHHILVQAPHGVACAYKEMGRCPAPCDGSVTLVHYHQQIQASIQFARSPGEYRKSLQALMQQRSEALDFEGAQRCKATLDRTAEAERRQFLDVRDLNEFRFLAVLPSERKRWARLMLIDGGRISPLADVSIDSSLDTLAWVAAALPGKPTSFTDLSTTDVENIGLVCRHLFVPAAQVKRRRAFFLRLPLNGDLANLSKAIRAVARETPEGPETATELAEQELERL